MKKTSIGGKRSRKKGQVWTLDYITGLLLFLTILITAFVIMKGYMSEKDTFKETARESDHIAAELLSNQEPNASSNTGLTIAENNRINITKLNEFDLISYEQKKTIFQTSGEYVFYFYNGTIINETTCFRGYTFSEDNCTLQIPPDASNIAKTERLVILKSEIVKLIVITWK